MPKEPPEGQNLHVVNEAAPPDAPKPKATGDSNKGRGYFEWTPYQPMEDLVAGKFLDDETGESRSACEVIKLMIQNVCESRAADESRDEQIPGAGDLQDVPQAHAGDQPGAQEHREGEAELHPRDRGGVPAVPEVHEVAEQPTEQRLRKKIRAALVRRVSLWRLIQDLLTSAGLDDDTTAGKLKSLQAEIVREFQEHPAGTIRSSNVSPKLSISRCAT